VYQTALTKIECLFWRNLDFVCAAFGGIAAGLLLDIWLML